jgi:ketosteroid isomerase-like protein
MTQVLFLAIALLNPEARRDTFVVQAELQALYDEISQATLQFVTAADIDQFHEVLYTPDWLFVDGTGQQRNWSQVREEAIHALSAPRFDAISQPIRKIISVDGDSATVVVDLTTVRTIVDEGRDGRQHLSHALTQTTVFRDRWVRVGDAWKLKSRVQIGGPTSSAGKSDPRNERE